MTPMRRFQFACALEIAMVAAALNAVTVSSAARPGPVITSSQSGSAVKIEKAICSRCVGCAINLRRGARQENAPRSIACAPSTTA